MNNHSGTSLPPGLWRGRWTPMRQESSLPGRCAMSKKMKHAEVLRGITP